MKRYDPFKDDCSNVDWTKYKIVVPTQEDQAEVQEAMKHFHNANIDTQFVTVNQMAHEYVMTSNIIVNKKLYDILAKGEDPCLNFD